MAFVLFDVEQLTDEHQLFCGQLQVGNQFIAQALVCRINVGIRACLDLFDLLKGGAKLLPDLTPAPAGVAKTVLTGLLGLFDSLQRGLRNQLVVEKHTFLQRLRQTQRPHILLVA